MPVLNYGEDEGITYIVMPYYSGGTLQDRVDNGGLGLDEVGRFMQELTDALQYAHDQGIVHQDIKPSNILLDKDGQAMLFRLWLCLCQRNIAQPYRIGAHRNPSLYVARTVQRRRGGCSL